MPPRAPFPSDAELHDELMEQFAIGLETCFVGVVQNLSADGQTCEVVPIVRQRIPQPDGTYEYEDYPVVPCVPILVQRGRDTFLSLPYANGDTVLCVILDADHTAWRRGQNDEVVSPRDLRLHHIQNAVVVGHFPRHLRALREASVKAAQATTDAGPMQGIVLGYDAPGGTRFLMKPDGSVEFTRGSTVVARIDPDGTVHIGGISGEFIALANLVDARLSTIRDAFNGHTHAVAGGTASAPTPMGSLASVAATKAKAT